MEQARKRIVGWALVLFGVVLGVQFALWFAYDASFDVWNVVNYFTAIVTIFALVVSFIRKRAFDADNDGTLSREYFEANVLFYGSIALAMTFFLCWISLLVKGREFVSDEMWFNNIWVIADVLAVSISCSLGRGLIRSANS